MNCRSNADNFPLFHSGDASEEDANAERAFEKEQWEYKNRDLAEQEAKKRAYKPRAKTDHNLCESIEIVQ
jgi:hypothetical protein